MKRIVAVLLVVFMVAGLVACGGGATGREQTEYMESLEKFRDAALEVGVRAETLSVAVQRVWREAIDDRRDFNDALSRFSSHENIVESRAEIRDMRSEVVSMYLPTRHTTRGA